jgi:uncharacterized protein YgbK (DUF1537 family)
MLSISDLAVVADDLTGACDVAAVLVPATGPVSVQVSAHGTPILPTWGVNGRDSTARLTVINAQSRLLVPEAARAAFESIGKGVGGKRVILVKIDSALRGPVGAELEGLIRGVGPRRVIVAPAIPRIGRTTRGGRQYDRGVPIDRTAYAGDPASPIRSADLADLLGRTGRVECSVYDAESDEDLSRIVSEALDGPPVVLVGSLGLAGALAPHVERLALGEGSWPDARVAVRPLLVCGSAYERTQRQIRYAAERRNALVLDIPAGEDEYAGPLAAGDGPPAIVRLDPRRADVAADPHSTVLPRFVQAAGQLVAHLQPDGLGIVGGETAMALLGRLAAERVTVYGRASEVIAYGVIQGGSMHGCRLVTKGGSVGPDDAVVQMIDLLLGSNGEQL